MPTYDFKCPGCNDTGTVIASIREEIPTPVCFKCKQPMIRKFGVGDVQFKGPGFYRTDK